MTQLLEKAFSEAAKLPPEEQDALAKWLLEEMESERRWQTAFDNSLDMLEQLADEALAERREVSLKHLKSALKNSDSGLMQVNF